jgi:hypothetical protein
MKGHYLILWGSVLFLIAVTNWSIVIAFDPTNTTISKTPANTTVLEKNGIISQPRTPLLVSPENNSANNNSVSNITGR